MRILWASFGLFLLLLAASFGVLYLGERSSRKAALDRTMEEAMRAAVETRMLRPYYELNDGEAMAADVMNAVLPLLEDAEIRVRLYGADADYGFLDMEIAAEIPFPLFGRIRISARHAVIADLSSAYPALQPTS